MIVPGRDRARPLGGDAVALAELRGRRRGDEIEQVRELVRLRGAGRRSASAHGRCRRPRRPCAGRAGRGRPDSAPPRRSRDGTAHSPGGSSVQQAARQPLRAEVDRLLPAGPVAPRTRRPPGRSRRRRRRRRPSVAAAASRDRPRRRRRGGPPRPSSGPGPGSARPARAPRAGRRRSPPAGRGS